MAKFNFNLRKANDIKETPVNLVIRWGGNAPLVFPTGKIILPKHWNKETQRARSVSGFTNHRDFNHGLDIKEQAAKNVFTQLENLNGGKLPTKEQVRRALRKAFDLDANQKANLLSLAEVLIQEQTSRLRSKGKFEGKSTVVNTYKQTVRVLQEYQSSRRKRVDFDTISLDFYYDFIKYLEESLYALNTIGKYIKTLKAFLNEANERGISEVKAHKSKHFKVLKEEVDTISLDEKELEVFYGQDLSSRPALARARDLFIVGCYTGLRFSDFNRIEPKHIKGGFIQITQQKTDAPVVIPIHPIVREIMSRYKNETYNSFPPSLSNQKLNDRVKDIGKLIEGFKKVISVSGTRGGKKVIVSRPMCELITTHTARRSFATNQFYAGVPSLTIMAITGHKTEKAFLKYIKVSPDQHAKILQSHWNRQHLKAV